MRPIYVGAVDRLARRIDRAVARKDAERFSTLWIVLVLDFFEQLRRLVPVN
jgi:hypothetical protein